MYFVGGSCFTKLKGHSLKMGMAFVVSKALLKFAVTVLPSLVGISSIVSHRYYWNDLSCLGHFHANHTISDVVKISTIAKKTMKVHQGSIESSAISIIIIE